VALLLEHPAAVEVEVADAVVELALRRDSISRWMAPS
jgi:hypothetical protein